MIAEQVRSRRIRRLLGLAASEFVVLFAFWILLSGQWRWGFLAMGALCAAAVSALTAPMLIDQFADPDRPYGPRGIRLIRLLVFGVWILWCITVSSLQIALLVVRRGKGFQPRFVIFDTDLERPVSRVMLATAITAVPGTMTVRLEGNRLLVHTLFAGSADDLASGRTQSMIGRITGEGDQPVPLMHWAPADGCREAQRR